MTAEIKGFQTFYRNEGEEFITHGYRSWQHATENFQVYEESACHIGYVKQLSPVNKSFNEAIICKKASYIILNIL